MIKKFWYLVRYGLKKKFKSKSFIISNIVIFVLLILIFNIESIISLFGGDFSQKINVFVIDNTQESFESLKNYYNVLNASVNDDEDEEEDNIVFKKSDKTKEELEKEVESSQDIIIELNPDSENYLTANIISENYIDTLTYQLLVQAINSTKYEKALLNSNIDLEELVEIQNPVTIERIILDESKNTEEESMSMVMDMVFPTIIMPFFMLIILLVQLIGGEIHEEKSTRSMEVIISNVSVKAHFYSKLVANNLFIIIQTILLFVYGAIGIFTRSLFGGSNSGVSGLLGDLFDAVKVSGILDKLYYIIPVTLILLFLSFIAYSLIAGVLASMTVNPEDYQQIQTPIMMICLVSYYLAIMAGMFDGSIFIKVLSYVPLISFLLSPALLVIGQVGIIDVMISIGLLVLLIVFLTKYGLKIYKVGILNYSTDKMWRKIFKAAKM